MSKFYITTTLPYVNAKPHIGFALEIIQADVVARQKVIDGQEVFFNFGTDEHGQKIYKKAIEENTDPQEYTDQYAKKFDALKNALNLSYNNFIRTTNAHHKKAAQELWKRCAANGFIEKGIYKAKYCVGCELEKQNSELENGKCPLHPFDTLESIEEENYFFKFSKFGDKLLNLYKSSPDFVVPSNRLKEVANFVSAGLQDFSVSRLKAKLPWGVEVPGDNKHVMYVWFDALTNYISALGWPEDETKFVDYWGTAENPNAIQVAGKDNLRQQSAMWQAMLMASGLPPTRQIFIHGFITSGGQKMSKSLGNVIDPLEYVENYGTDALRYYLLAKINPFEDSDFTKESFEHAYQSDLANGLGNLVARIAKLCESSNLKFDKNLENKTDVHIANQVEKFRFDKALALIWSKISFLDKYINEEEPWKKEGDNLGEILTNSVEFVRSIAFELRPFLPDTAEKISVQFEGPKINSSDLLFPRL
jgi:methionyl-tRNA synthetase